MMKLAATLAAVTILFAGTATLALASNWPWDINSFETDIKIGRDSTITVSEKITADFTREEHHGIYRYIPIKYRDQFGNKLDLRFNLVSIKDETGKPWTYEQSYEGDNVYLKIGDADTYLNRLSTFIITYNVERAVTYFNDHDEIYWNATGTEWDVPMKTVKTTVSIPGNPSNTDLKATCYTGGYGSEAQDCKTEIKNGTITYVVSPVQGNAYELYPNQGLTVVAGFPVGLVDRPSFIQQASWFLADNWGYFFPLITFCLMFYLWKTRGRDPSVSRTAIMPIYKPPNGLTPTEIGTIIDETVDIRDISSAIIDFAVRGYIKIKEIKEKQWLFESTDYEFEMVKDIATDEKLKAHEKKIADSIFDSSKTVKLSSLKDKFYKDIPGIKDSVYSGLVRDGYFPTNPEGVRNGYYAIGGVIAGIAFFGLGGFLMFFSLSVPIGIIASGIIILIFAGRMPAKTKKGVETFYLIKGLEEYINTAEKDRIKFQEKENIFEQLLPYAMTLGLATKWAKAFEGIYKTPPSWYSSNDPNWHNHFTTIYMLNRLTSVSSTMQSTFTSSPRSASGGGSGFSGGFSGGGFGGGGGGAW
jgi:uncharacterized membrane protein